MAAKKQSAVARARLFPSTYAHALLEGAKSSPRHSVAEVVEEWRKNKLK